MAYRLLDLFCGEGGASMGYHAAGFEVVGVDHKKMKRYPFEFIQSDLLDLDIDFLKSFDAIAASPPCKVHTAMRAFSSNEHFDMIPATRIMLEAAGKPFVIENVEGAPLINPIMLCGSMFELFVRRHRLFETNWPLAQMKCRHEHQAATSPGFLGFQYHSGSPVPYVSPTVTVVGRGNGYGPGESDLWREVMGMPWASKDGMREAIPPAYTAWIGSHLIDYLNHQRKEEIS